MRNGAINRIRIISVIAVIVFCLLAVRLYFIQIVSGSEYVAMAEQQYVHTAQNIYNRGTILMTTRDGNRVSAASVRSGYMLAVNPSRITNAEEVYEQLAPYLSIDRELFLVRATLENRTFVEIERRVSRDDAAEIRGLQLRGVMLYRNQWRYYPGGSLSAQTIGFVAETGEESLVRGVYGLERFYDDVLYQPDVALSVNFFAEVFSNLGSLVDSRTPLGGGDVVTTLEPTVSRFLDTTIRDLQETYLSEHSGAIIMDPNTGKIVAMTSAPFYDNNNRSSIPVEQFRNPLVEDVFEFGSIVKANTIAAGLDAGVITPRSTYVDTGSVTYDGFTIRNFDGRARGEVDMQIVLSQSLNTGVAHIVNLMGTARFRDYLFSMGMNQQTGIDLPNEGRNLVGNLNSPRRVEYATASFGQGIALTPMSMIGSLAPLANGGFRVQPHIATHIEYRDGSSREIELPARERVLSQNTSDQISQMLINVVDEVLRGGQVALPHHSIGAKTGTAQIPNPATGGYYDDRFLHSFFGYFPAYEPEYLVLLYTVNPRGVQYASESLTDSFMDIATFLINYYDIPPDR